MFFKLYKKHNKRFFTFVTANCLCSEKDPMMSSLRWCLEAGCEPVGEA